MKIRRLSLLCLSWLICLAPMAADTHLSQPEARQVKLDGTRNTRELGGLPVAGGTFPTGLVYRSGALCFATQADAEKLLGKKIATIVELRTEEEIAKDGPDKPYLTQGVPNLVHWPMTSSRGPGLAAYESLMQECGPLIGDFFTLLAQQDNYPVLYHCSAGKDRAGILTALLLDLLGTPRAVIYDDYLHSMRITAKLKVDKTWLDAVFAAVDAVGGTEPYLKAHGVTDAEIASVRTLLTAHPHKNS